MTASIFVRDLVRILFRWHLTWLKAVLGMQYLLTLFLVLLLHLLLELFPIVKSDKCWRDEPMRVQLCWGKDHLVWWHEEELVLELLLVWLLTIVTGMLSGGDLVCLGAGHVCGSVAHAVLTATYSWGVDSHQVKIVKALRNFAQLIFVLLIVESSSYGLDWLVSLCLPFLRHK